MSREAISAAFPFESRFIEVLGSRMHYIEEGEGEPILFLHGNPTSSYLWRNVIPHLSPFGRCIALDLIGMGRSDKPEIEYRFADHARYVEGFINALGLRNITLVIHDWGAALGFDYATRNSSNVRAIAFMEALIRSPKWREQPLMVRFIFRRLRHPVKGRRMVIGKNFFVERLLPMMAGRRLTPDEMAQYREPYLEPKSREPLLRWPQEIPFDGSPGDTHERVTASAAWIKETPCPKLMLWVRGGALIPEKEAKRLGSELSNLESVCLGKGKHFVQEQYPHEIGRYVSAWYRKLEGRRLEEVRTR